MAENKSANIDTDTDMDVNANIDESMVKGINEKTPRISLILCGLCNIPPRTDECAYFTGRYNWLPDFTKPLNFCKLYELKINYLDKETSIAELISYYLCCFKMEDNIVISNRASFLQALCRIIVQCKDLEPPLYNLLTSTIREEYWQE